MSEAKLIRTINTSAFPSNEAYAADINGDGRMEILFLQAPGTFQSGVFDSAERKVAEEMKNVFCLTAVDGGGEVLWQYGTPFRDGRWPSHVADQAVWCGDIDGDGRVEVVAIRRQKLVVLDGATGRLLRSTMLDADNYSILIGFDTRHGVRLLVKNSERGFEGYWYGDPACIYDAELDLVAKLPKTLGSGHSPRAFDIDGDGFEELLIGYEAYDADGNRLWQLTGQDVDDYVPLLHHVDQLQVGRLGSGGEVRIIYAGSWDIKLAAPDGELIWQYELGHPQHVIVGDFRGGGKRAPLAFQNVQITGFWHTIGRHLIDSGTRHGLELRDEQWSGNALISAGADGELVHIFYPEVLWPGCPDRTGGSHSGEGLLIWPQGAPDGSDAIIAHDWGWPRAFDLVGEELFTFPYPGEASASVNADGYGMRILDFDNDGRAEVLVCDHSAAWVFKPPLPAAGAPNTHHKLRPVTGQGWYAT